MLALLLALTLLAPPTSRVDLVGAGGATTSVQVEVADDPSEWTTGLMGRTTLAEDAGMLFVFPSDVSYPFWMQDTPIPLSIAFIAADGRLLDQQDMAANSTDFHYAAEPYRYALEVNQGFFARHGLTVGDRALLFPTRVLLPRIDG